FFFSSRRRHTRSYGDWSSDVCSSDLQTAQICVVSFGIVRRFCGDDLLFPAGEMDAQLIGDCFGYFALGCKNVSQFAIKAIGPERSEERRVGKECRSELSAEDSRIRDR